MNMTRVTNVGLVAVAVLSAGFLVSRVAQAAPAPAQCTTNCSETKYVKLCTLGTYVYYTKPTCNLCSGNGKGFCDDRSMDPTCTEDTMDKMKIKAVTSTAFCPYTVGNTNYSYAEANPVDAGEVTGDEHNRWRCKPAPAPVPPAVEV